MRSISAGETGLWPRSEDGDGSEYTTVGDMMRDDTTIRGYKGERG